MTHLRTTLRLTRENARRYRFEPVGVITQTNVQRAIEQVASGLPGGLTPTPIVVGQSPYVPLVTDTILYIDTSGGPITIDMPAASTRTLPLTIKDVTGHALANNISIVASGAETIDGVTPYLIASDFGALRLLPRSGSGYAVDA